MSRPCKFKVGDLVRTVDASHVRRGKIVSVEFFINDEVGYYVRIKRNVDILCSEAELRLVTKTPEWDRETI